jgi:hypothetical protein
MGMMLRLGSGGSVTELSFTGRYRGGGDGGDKASMELPLSRRWSILLIFEKLITRSVPAVAHLSLRTLGTAASIELAAKLLEDRS